MSLISRHYAFGKCDGMRDDTALYPRPKRRGFTALFDKKAAQRRLLIMTKVEQALGSQGALGPLGQHRKGGGIMHGDISQHPAIQIDIGALEAVNHAAVRQAI